MPTSDTWPGDVAMETVICKDSTGSCDSVVSMNSNLSDDSLDYFAPDVRATLMFLEETIESLNLELEEEDSGLSNDELDAHTPTLAHSPVPTDKTINLCKPSHIRPEDVSRYHEDPNQVMGKDHKPSLSYMVPTPLLLANGSSFLRPRPSLSAADHKPEPAPELLTADMGVTSPAGTEGGSTDKLITDPAEVTTSTHKFDPAAVLVSEDMVQPAGVKASDIIAGTADVTTSKLSTGALETSSDKPVDSSELVSDGHSMDPAEMVANANISDPVELITTNLAAEPAVDLKPAESQAPVVPESPPHTSAPECTSVEGSRSEHCSTNVASGGEVTAPQTGIAPLEAGMEFIPPPVAFMDEPVEHGTSEGPEPSALTPADIPPPDVPAQDIPDSAFPASDIPAPVTPPPDIPIPITSNDAFPAADIPPPVFTSLDGPSQHISDASLPVANTPHLVIPTPEIPALNNPTLDIPVPVIPTSDIPALIIPATAVPGPEGDPQSVASPSQKSPGESLPVSITPASVGPASIGPLSIEPESVGPGHIRPASVGPVNIGPASVGPASVGPASVGPASMGPASVGPANMGPASVGPANVGPASVGPANVGPANVGPPVAFMDEPVEHGTSEGPEPSALTPAASVGPANVGPASVGPASVGPASVGQVNMGPTNVGPASVGPVTVGPANIGPANVGPASVGPVSVAPAFQRGPLSYSELAKLRKKASMKKPPEAVPVVQIRRPTAPSQASPTSESLPGPPQEPCDPKSPPAVAPKPKKLPSNIILKPHRLVDSASGPMMDPQKVRMEALRKLGLLKSDDSDSAPSSAAGPSLSPRSRRSWAMPPSPVTSGPPTPEVNAQPSPTLPSLRSSAGPRLDMPSTQHSSPAPCRKVEVRLPPPVSAASEDGIQGVAPQHAGGFGPLADEADDQDELEVPDHLPPSPPAGRFPPGSENSSAPRCHGISVQISPLSENEGDRRQALRKLGLLRN